MLRVDRRLLVLFAAASLVGATALEACVIQPQPIPPLEGNEDNGPGRPYPGDSAGAPNAGGSGGTTSGATAGTTSGTTSGADAAAPTDGGGLDAGADAGDGNADAGNGDAGDGDAGDGG